MYILFVSFVSLGILYFGLTTIAQETNHQPEEFLSISVGNYETTPAYQETKHFQQMQEHIQGWKVHQGEQEYGFLTLHQYYIYNGDQYYYLRYLPKVDETQDLVLTLPVSLSNFEYRTIEYPRGLDYSKSVWSEPTLASAGNKLPTSSLFVDDILHGSYFFSYIDVFGREENAVKKELYHLARPIKVLENGIELHFPHKKDGIVEQWGLLSPEPLIDWDNQTAVEDLRIADLNRVRKWGQEGPFYLTPSSYTPFSATSFYRNPAHHIGEKFLRSSGAQFFEDFALVSLYTATRTQNERGYWYMTTQSNWLYEDYSIPRTYYDTRFSTDAALFLIKGYERYQEPVFLEAAKEYGEFLVKFAQSHHFKTINNGYLVWDYGHDFLPYNPTHVSLNHLVSEMNFLYKLYKVTEESSYLDLAQKIKLAVKDTAPYWKKEEDGDLWYAYLVDGSYGLQDYPLLTLKDLRYSQQLIKEIDGAEDLDFAYLIQVKEEYLKTNNLALQ